MPEDRAPTPGHGNPPIPALTSIRFAAALMVMTSHSVSALYPGGFTTPLASAASLAMGNAAMSLFFALSGFILVHTYRDYIEGPGKAGALRFYAARIARIYPAYLLLLLVSVLFYRTDQLTPAGIIAHLSLTQSWFPGWNSFGTRMISEFQYVEIAWSISTEAFFYLIFPLLCATLFRLRGSWALAAAVAVWLAQLSVGELAQVLLRDDPRVLEWFLYYSPYLRMAEFCVGGLLSRFAADLPRPSRLAGAFMPALSVLLFAGSVCVFFIPGVPTWFTDLRITGGYVPAAAFVVFCFYRYPAAVADHPLLVLAGDASYSFYLFHAMFISASMKFGPAPSADGEVFLLRFGAAVALNLIASIILFKLFENPSRRFIRAFLDGRVQSSGEARTTPDETRSGSAGPLAFPIPQRSRTPAGLQPPGSILPTENTLRGATIVTYANPFLEIELTRVDFGGFTKDYHVVVFGPRVGVVACRGGAILLTRQYRFLVDGLAWEIPGGRVEAGESFDTAGARECLEETGIRCRNLEPLVTYYPGLDNVDNCTTLFYSSDTEDTGTFSPDSREVEAIAWVPLGECLRMIYAREILDALTIAGILAFHGKVSSGAIRLE